MGLINEEEEAPNGWRFLYPAYMLYCPDKTLIERAVLRYCTEPFAKFHLK